MTTKKPEIVDILETILGVDAAKKLMCAKGIAGCSITIPLGRKGRSSKTHDLLVNTVGEEAKEKIIAHFGGERIYIPRDHFGQIASRNRQIVLSYEKGNSVCDIAADFGMSDRHIREILKTTDMTTPH